MGIHPLDLIATVAAANAPLVDVAEALLSLQEARHQADYDQGRTAFGALFGLTMYSQARRRLLWLKDRASR